MAAVDEKVKQIIVEQLGVDEGEVTSSASFVDDLGADSLTQSNSSWLLKKPSTSRFPTRTRKRSAPFRTPSITSPSTRKAGSNFGTQGRRYGPRFDLRRGQYHR